MDSFHWVTATLTMVLSLGMTRLLTSGVNLFKSRGRAKMDWVPLVWALCIFYSNLEFSWVIQSIGGLAGDWTFQRFLALFSLVIVLFLASAMILPGTELNAGDALRASFERDGRWALIFLAAYDLLAMGANWYYWHASPLGFSGAVNLTLTLLAVALLMARSRKVECGITIAYAVIDLGLGLLI